MRARAKRVSLSGRRLALDGSDRGEKHETRIPLRVTPARRESHSAAVRAARTSALLCPRSCTMVGPCSGYAPSVRSVVGR
jgi:hypothetical protein